VFVKPHKKKQKSGNRPVHPPAGKGHTAFCLFCSDPRWHCSCVAGDHVGVWPNL